MGLGGAAWGLAFDGPLNALKASGENPQARTGCGLANVEQRKEKEQYEIRSD